MFYVLEHGPGFHDHVEDYVGKHGNEMGPDVVQLTLENVTATELEDLWAWSSYGNIALWGSALDWIQKLNCSG